MKFSLLGVVLFFVVVGTTAQEQKMDLNECLSYGLVNSPYVTLSQNELKMFKYNKRDLYAAYLPSINASGQLDYNAKLPVTVIPAGEFAPQEIRMKMGTPHGNSAAIQLEQKIYDQASLLGINRVKDYQELSQLNSEKIVEDLTYNIAMAYYQVLVVSQRIQLLEDSRDQYTELNRIMELQLEKGVIKQVDYNRIRVAFNNIQSQLSLVQTGKQDALNYLKVMIGMPLETELVINEDESLLVETSLPEASEVDISNRLDFRINMKNIDLQGLNTKVTKYSFLPTLSAYARYGANSYAENFRDSWSQFNDFASIGLTLQIPIFNGLRVNTAYHKEKIRLENLTMQSKIMEESYKVELLNAKTKMIEAFTSLTTNSDNLELAKEVYEMTNLSYQAGATSLTDFLNAEFSYKEAQTNYLASLINMLTSRLDYEKSKGNITNYLNN